MHGLARLDCAQSFSQPLRSPSHHHIMIPLEERTRQRRQYIHPKLRRLDLPVITCNCARPIDGKLPEPFPFQFSSSDRFDY